MKHDATDLSPRLSVKELYQRAMDPTYWDRLDQIAAHPSAWPQLRRWASVAQDIGPELAGEPPSPPEPEKHAWMRRLKRTQPAPCDGPAAADLQSEITERIQPVTEDRTVVEARPRRSVRALLRSALAPLCCVILAAAIGAGAYWGFGCYQQHEHTVSGQRQVQQAQVARRRLKDEHDQGERLVKDIRNSPVAQEMQDKVQHFAGLLDKHHVSAQSLSKDRKQLEGEWNKAMDDKANAAHDDLAGLIGHVDACSTMPDSPELTDARKLAEQWRGKQIDRKNLSRALSAVDQLRKLTTQIDQEHAKQQDQSPQQQPAPQQPAPAPQTARPIAPQPHPSYRQAPPVSSGAGPAGPPSWSVPPAQDAPALPGADSSL